MYYKCKICGFIQEKRVEVESHIESKHPMEALILKTESLGDYDG